MKLAIGAGNGGGVSGIISGTARALLADRTASDTAGATLAGRCADSDFARAADFAFGFAAWAATVRRAAAFRSGFRAGLREGRLAFAIGGLRYWLAPLGVNCAAA